MQFIREAVEQDYSDEFEEHFQRYIFTVKVQWTPQSSPLNQVLDLSVQPPFNSRTWSSTGIFPGGGNFLGFSSRSIPPKNTQKTPRR